MPRIRKPKKSEVQELKADCSDEIVDTILERISNGELLISICKEKGMPHRTTFYRWIERPELRKRYTYARQNWADWHAETIMSVVTDPLGSEIDESGNRLPATMAEINARRLWVDTVKFLTSKLAPRVYGERPDLPAEPMDQVQAITRTIKFEFDPGPSEPAPTTPPPLALTFDPGPLPERLDQEILARLIRALKDNVPKADQRDPREILDEAMGVIERALKATYARPEEEAPPAPTTLAERIDARSLTRFSRRFVTT